jgi:hypothetical protein
MRAELLAFGEIEIEGQWYSHDVVIESGRVRKRGKKPSKAYRDEYGHTPLSNDEEIPWTGPRLIVGTGVYGRLPIMPQVHEEASRRGVEIVALPTKEACAMLGDLPADQVSAILHVTC